MLVFAGLVPNSPILLSSINPDRIKEAEKTLRAIEEFAEELYSSQPDTLILLAEGQTMYPDAFSVDVADPFATDLSEFGDLRAGKTYHPDFGLIDRLQRAARKTESKISLTTDESLNFAAAVPLELLAGHLPAVRVVPIAPTQLPAKVHFEMGALIKDVAQEHHGRVAVIACGVLSHALSDESPAGMDPAGEKFDNRMWEILEQKNTAGLLQLDPELVHAAHDASYRQICMLFGVLEGINVTPHLLSYESPFGVGYAVAHFHLR